MAQVPGAPAPEARVEAYARALAGRAGQVALGPAVGEGAVLYPEAFPNPVGPTRPSAGWLARVIAEERVELHDPEPLYLRRPDAAMPGTPKRVS